MDIKLTPEQLAEINNAEAAAEDLARDGHTSRRCLACGGELVVEERGGGSAYLVRCKSEDRVVTSGRGI